MSTESAAVSFVTEKLQAHGYEVVDKNIEKPNHRAYDLVARKAGVEALLEVKGLQKPTPLVGKARKGQALKLVLCPRGPRSLSCLHPDSERNERTH
jgi:hypothetical protein